MVSAVASASNENDAGSASGSDSKKRNKLGYHRTAVACGHCRRRKIRCIPSLDTSENRCQNCIRLKKECQFYPVDQNGVNTRKSRSDSKPDSSFNEPTVSNSSPSPEISTSSAPSSYDTHIPEISGSGGWAGRPNYVTSPAGTLSSAHPFEQQNWTTSQPQIQHQYPRHNSHSSYSMGTYWMANEDSSSIAYQQHQFPLPTTSAQSQDPQLIYNNHGLTETRHQSQRQSFSGVPNNSIQPTNNAYRHHSATFPEIERSMTMPALYSHSDSSTDMSMQTSPPLGSELGHYPFNSVLPQHIAQSPSANSWFPHNPQQPFASPYLPSHVQKHT